MNICEHLTQTAAIFPDQPAIIFEGRTLTFADLDCVSASAAQFLDRAGIRPQDRVALVLPNTPAFVVWYYAALRQGSIVVSISTRLSPKEMAYVLNDSGASVCIAQSDVVITLEDQLPDCVSQIVSVQDEGELIGEDKLPDDSHAGNGSWFDADPHSAALILYTSGTTGFAKGATLSHQNVRATVNAFNHLCGMQPDDRMLLSVPLFHCFGQNALLNSCLNAGATVVLQRGFDLNESKQLIIEHQVNKLFGVPTTFQLLEQSCTPTDLRSVTYCFSAAAKLPIQVGERWQRKFGQPIYEGYGLTETAPFASYNHRLKFRPGSIGAPVDLVEMKITDTDTGATCPPGKLGEIAIRGPNVMLGYWNRPEETQAAIRDGWFYSGDIGRTDEQGYFYIVDRVKDMIAVGGLKVYPAEVERILLDHAAVSQAAVVGMADELFGERVVAFVVPAETHSADLTAVAGELKQHCKKALASYKVPQLFHFLDKLPRNPSGKVLKTKLREINVNTPSHGANDRGLAAGNGSPAPSATDSPAKLSSELAQTHPAGRLRVTTNFLQNEVAEIIGSDDLPGIEDRFIDTGLDSLMIVDLRNRLQGQLDTQFELPTTLVFDYPRICDLAAFLVQIVSESDENHTESPANFSKPPSVASSREDQLKQQIAALTEAEALDELMRELDS